MQWACSYWSTCHRSRKRAVQLISCCVRRCHDQFKYLYYCYYTTISEPLLLYYYQWTPAIILLWVNPCYYTTISEPLLLYYYQWTPAIILLSVNPCYYTAIINCTGFLLHHSWVQIVLHQDAQRTTSSWSGEPPLSFRLVSLHSFVYYYPPLSLLILFAGEHQQTSVSVAE